jgi:four helix bundle protein
MDLAVVCHRTTSRFPSNEQYGLTSQIRRAAGSVPANIAEGHGRENTGSFIQFLRISQGSLKELETHAILAARVGYLDAEEETEILERATEIGKMIRALIRRLQEKK